MIRYHSVVCDRFCQTHIVEFDYHYNVFPCVILINVCSETNCSQDFWNFSDETVDFRSSVDIDELEIVSHTNTVD